MSRDELQRAYDLIKSGEGRQAETLLEPIVAADPDNMQAWWLLANAVDNPIRKRSALRQVLRLQPDHAKAQAMMAKLEEPVDETQFDFDEPDSGPVLSTGGQRVVVTKPKRQNRSCLVILLVFIFGACGLCTLSVVALGGSLGSVVLQAINDPEVRAAFSQITQYGSLPTNLEQRGSIEIGQTVKDEVSPGHNQAWTFSGSSGDNYSITLRTQNDNFVAVVFLYGPDSTMQGFGLSAGSAQNLATINQGLSSTGQYTIVVTAFGQSGGSYELTLNRQG